MQAAVLHQPGPIETSPLELEERAPLVPASGEIVLRVAACALCRTDLQICEGDLLARTLPIVPGHQVVGYVTAVGDGVAGWQPGDRAGIAWLAGACGGCRFCQAGRENLCLEARFTGWDRDGGFAQQVAVDAAFALRLPAGLPDDETAPLLCGGIIGYRSLKVSGIQPGGRLGLYGFGASARLAIQVALHWGCQVYVCTRSPAEQQAALELGAVWAGDYGQRPPQPLDAAVTFAPAGSVVIAALEALDRGGTVAINAIHLDGVPAFDYQKLWWERSIRSVANFTREDAREFLALAGEAGISPRVQRFALAEANTALQRLRRGEGDGTAVLVT